MKNKNFYMFIVLNIFLSIVIANIYSIKMKFVDNINEFTTINNFAANYNIKNTYKIDTTKKYQFVDISIFNYFKHQIAHFNIQHSITGEHIILVNNIFNQILNNKITNQLHLLSKNTHINSLFINLIFIFIMFYVLYMFINYIFKIIFMLFVKIDIKLDKIRDNNYITIGLLLISLILFSMAYFTNSISSYIFTSSDELFLFDVLKDLMHGGSINNWYLSGAFQFFPAIPILSIIYLFTIKIYYIAYFYAIIQILLFYFIVAYFLKVFLSSKKSYYITSIFIWICVYLGINFNDYNLLFIHSFHFETFMLSVLSYGLILNCYKKNNADIVRLLYLSVIQILGIMSDRFFVVWLVAPLLIVLSILYFTDKYFKKFLTIKICLLLFFNTIVAIILYKLIFIHSFEPDNYFIFQSRYAFQNKIMSMLLSESFITIIILIFIGYIIFLLKNNNKIAIYCQINDLFKLSILLLKVLFILLVTILSVGQYFIFTMRYCIPLLYINTFILMFLCYQILGNKLNLTIIIILSGLFTLKYFDHMKFNDNYYHDDIKCVENILNKYHVKYGLSDYWVARRFNYINQSNIDIVPIDRYTYKHMLWMDNEKHKYKSYDFILISSESPLSLVDSIIKLNGKPEFIGRCNQYEIVIYKNFMLKKY